MAYISGLYTGLKYVAGLVDNDEQVQQLDSYLNSIVDARKEDSVVSITMFPSYFYSTNKQPVTEYISVARPNKIDGYTPKNKKLFTYPYCFLNVDTLNDNRNYKFEFSDYTKDGSVQKGTQINFMMIGTTSSVPEIIVVPRWYNGSGKGGNYSPNPTEDLACNGFPQCAFSIDSYRAYVAQKSSGDMLKIGGILGTMGASLSPVAGILGAVGLASQINNMVLGMTEGDKAKGVPSSQSHVASGLKNIYFKHMSITHQYAKMIDNFFDRFGYATCLTKVPNRNVRPHWTYTKTKECSLKGNAPVDDINKLKSIYDNGITFWRNGSEVGRYDLDNSV